ncbi:uncharacterized protein [Argopecten irradians]|uniref:uncharacterized protein isoform X2 n=1 Tax=Argopecten irradians TaxID=31199 RepID=UPI00371BD354
MVKAESKRLADMDKEAWPVGLTMATHVDGSSEESAESRRRSYEDALKNDKIKAILDFIYDEPEKLLNAKRAILHHVCLGEDPRDESFPKQLKQWIKAKDAIPRHDDVYKFEEDENNQEIAANIRRRSYEDALKNDKVKRILDFIDDEPEKLLKAKRAILHHVCLGEDPRDESFPKQLKQWIKAKDAIPRHDDVYNFEEDIQEVTEESSNAKGNDAKESPHQATEKGSDATESPHQATEKASDAKESPHQATEKGSDATESPHQATEKASDITDGPHQVELETNKDSSHTLESGTGSDITPQDTIKDSGGNSDGDQTSTGKNDFAYPIGQEKGKRHALYIGIRHFERRGEDGQSDGTGIHDFKLNREGEERIDRKEVGRVFENIGFTLKSNDKESEITEKKVDALVDQVLNDAVEKKAEIIIVVISSHGEEVLEISQIRKDKNVLRHRILMEDKHLYTDDLLTKFESKRELKGIPKLLFIQACRSGVRAEKEDIVDKGTPILVECNPMKSNEGDDVQGNKSLSDAKPRSKPKPPGQSGPPAKPPDQSGPQTNLPIDAPNSMERMSAEAKPHSETSEVKYPEDKAQSKGSHGQSIHKAEIRKATKPQLGRVDTSIALDIDEVPAITCIEDSLVMFASAQGKEAYRKEYTGGWLTIELCKSLTEWKKNPGQDLLQVLTGIIGNVAINKETQDGYKSAAAFSHMLTKDIFLFPRKS